MTDSNLNDATRRAVLKGAAGALGVSAMGSASAHKWGEESGPAGTNSWTSADEDTRGEGQNAAVVGYHALGSAGAPNRNREAEAQDPHYGGLTEITTHGDYAYVTIFSSDSPTPGRGMAILDISDYNRAETREDLKSAELSVISFLRNNNTATAMMDVKVSDDGEYVFISTQPYTALFGGLPNTNSDDPTRAEVADPTPNTDDESANAQAAGILAVDVSDKANPKMVGTFSLEGTGSHNAYHHRINGEEYVFAIQDSGNLVGVGDGMYVLRFDRATGVLELVNRWHFETNNRQGEVSTEYAYIHDMEVQDDPRTGTPVVYLAYWDRGLWALDASDPENLEALGHFEMGSSHFASPAPTLVGGKRVVVTSQEISESDTHTGRVYLVDADGLFDDDPRFDSVPRDDNGVVQMGELALWEWQNEYQYPNDDNAVEFGPYDFSLSPHNSDFARHVDPKNGTEEFWVHQAHYGGGIQYLEVKTGKQDGLVGADARFTEPDGDTDGNGLSGAADEHNTTDWRLRRRGYARPTYGTPKESRIEGLNYITPFVWGASESNGVTFASDINQGVHAIIHDDIPVGGADPVVGINRSDDGSLFTGGQTDRVSLDVAFSDRDVLVRDRLPESWNAIEGDEYDTVEAGGSQYIQFSEPVSGGDTLRYFASVGSETGAHQLGPVKVSDDGGDTWHTLAETTDTNYVIGQSTSLALGSSTVGVAGVLANRSDGVRERLSGLFGDE
jgi:hypothetical protein